MTPENSQTIPVRSLKKETDGKNFMRKLFSNIKSLLFYYIKQPREYYHHVSF